MRGRLRTRLPCTLGLGAKRVSNGNGTATARTNDITQAAWHADRCGGSAKHIHAHGMQTASRGLERDVSTGDSVTIGILLGFKRLTQAARAAYAPGACCVLASCSKTEHHMVSCAAEPTPALDSSAGVRAHSGSAMPKRSTRAREDAPADVSVKAAKKRKADAPQKGGEATGALVAVNKAPQVWALAPTSAAHAHRSQP